MPEETPEAGERLKIAMLAPPWIPIPAPAYGGIEEMIRLLTEELSATGHDVTLFAPPGSRSPAKVETLLEQPHPDEVLVAIYEADHTARAFESIDRAAEAGNAFDVMRDH